MKGLLGLYTVFAALLFASCQKEDRPVPLPAQGDTEYSVVEMGEEYTNQVFFDLETGRVVHMSEVNSWHLAFETSVEGFHIFQNGAYDVLIYNTHETDFTKVTSAPATTSAEWKYDASCGLPDSTAFGDWRSKNEIYIVKLNPTYDPNNLKKMRLVAVSSKEYVMEYADLEENITHTIRIPKDENYNYSYFTFADGGKIVQPDPPKNTWDIVFTRYRIVYYDLGGITYGVSGVLLNPYNTTAAVDSTTPFVDLVGEKIFELQYTNHRDVIGYDWKEYSFATERYKIFPNKNYVIKNRNDQYWKMHFLDFYNKQGVKGSPSFEFQRVY